MSEIVFKDYSETGVVYHVVTITDLSEVLKHGLKFDGKHTYVTKYQEFHEYIDRGRPDFIPEWVVRSKAIFASLNFKDNHSWHSHSAVLSLKLNMDKCWVCNENIANFLYEPLMLQKIDGFEAAKDFIGRNGPKILKDYWNSSLSFEENINLRYDKKRGYDAEVLILHDIPPEDINILYIASDHRYMDIEQWKQSFMGNQLCYFNC